MAVTKRTRFEVLRRDGNRCRYCGRGVEDGAKLTIDHVNPKALGGSDDSSNLVAACSDCNAGKTSSTPDTELVADVDREAIRWAAARERAFLRWRTDGMVREELRAEFLARWSTWGYPDDAGERQMVPMASGWEDTLDRWLKEGFTVADLDGFIKIAMQKPGLSHRDTWRYFCGVVWRNLDEIQAATSDYLHEDED